MNLLIALATTATLNTAPPDVVPLDPPAGKVPQAMLAHKPFKDRHPRWYQAGRVANRIAGPAVQIVLYVVLKR